MPSSEISNTVQPNWQSVPPVVVGTGTNLFLGVGGAPGFGVGDGGGGTGITWAVGGLRRTRPGGIQLMCRMSDR